MVFRNVSEVYVGKTYKMHEKVGVDDISKYYHKIWHPPPQKKNVGKYLNPLLKGDKMFRPPPRAPNQSPSPQKHKTNKTLRT
jgi:hypothetical protein